LPAKVGRINLVGLTPELAQQIQSRINIRINDTLDAYGFGRLSGELTQIDEHLRANLSFARSPGTEQTVSVNISLQAAAPIRAVGGPAQPYSGPAPIQVGGTLMERSLINKVVPPYPDLAKATRIQGPVRYDVIIGADGTVQNIQLNSGNPMLATQAVMDAVRQWTYQPYLLNGIAVPIKTEIVINFALN
jgi:TonB family protein